MATAGPKLHRHPVQQSQSWIASVTKFVLARPRPPASRTQPTGATRLHFDALTASTVTQLLLQPPTRLR
ncbi:hypothetical protein CALVIDRAFT_536928 [Calocera viscosa TUFC12733]|uniref:Uncharacterized protein n=1 Tax=Calocera viscosa (strain TUFC12733) TaxID=1330018 RepID=A0A167MC64_CALVF|nr:hypothetical protein CALVIDRAFT_536928 [Calocera viscosa TUFC12733]